ncbi:sulfurtransferase [bacterium SCSIO 12741]|nr:sulfurtransferase [bacterium SCSIO 12741]
MVYPRLIAWASLLGLLVSCSTPKEEVEVAPLNWPENNLMEVSDLGYWMDQPDVVFVDIRLTDRYMTGHIPGAIHLTRKDLENAEMDYAGAQADREQLQALLSQKGVKPTDRLIIYDARGQVEAARFWWIMLGQGHQQMVLLNGGIQSWKSAGNQVCTENCDHRDPTHYVFERPKSDQWSVYKEELIDRLSDSTLLLVDARNDDEYTGERQKKGAYRAGHIPGAILINYTESLSPDYTFKTADSLRALFQSHQVNPEEEVLVYCHSGVRSSHTLFVLTQILGYENVRNYDGSWIEWSKDESLPLVSHP